MTRRAISWIAWITVACVTMSCAAGHAVRSTTTGAQDAVLSISVAGGEATLIDPLRRTDRGGAQPRSEIPRCSRIEGSMRDARSAAEAQAARVQLDVLGAMPGRYRLVVRATGSVVLVNVSGESKALRCGSGDHVLSTTGKTYEWYVMWRPETSTSKCDARLVRK